MVLGVMEGQIRGGYFPDYIFDPSVVDCNDQSKKVTLDVVLHCKAFQKWQERNMRHKYYSQPGTMKYCKGYFNYIKWRKRHLGEAT